MYLADEVLEHLLGDQEVGDHAVFQRPDGGDVARCPTQHPLCVEADGSDRLLVALHPDRDHRGFVQNDALIAHVDERVGCPEVNG